MAEHHRAQHHIFRQLLRFRFDHQHGALSTGDHQIQLRIRKFRRGWVKQVLTVGITHTRRGDRAIERDAGQRQRGRRANHGGDIGIDLAIRRHHRRNDLDFVVETFRKQRAQRAIDQTASQDFLFAQSTFAFKKTTGNFARGVSFLLILYGQREEILIRLGIFPADHGDQHHSVIQTDHHRTAGLTRDFAGFQSELMIAE